MTGETGPSGHDQEQEKSLSELKDEIAVLLIRARENISEGLRTGAAKKKSKTSRQVALEIGVTQPTISKWEAGGEGNFLLISEEHMPFVKAAYGLGEPNDGRFQQLIELTKKVRGLEGEQKSATRGARAAPQRRQSARMEREGIVTPPKRKKKNTIKKPPATE